MLTILNVVQLLLFLAKDQLQYQTSTIKTTTDLCCKSEIIQFLNSAI